MRRECLLELVHCFTTTVVFSAFSRRRFLSYEALMQKCMEDRAAPRTFEILTTLICDMRDMEVRLTGDERSLLRLVVEAVECAESMQGELRVMRQLATMHPELHARTLQELVSRGARREMCLFLRQHWMPTVVHENEIVLRRLPPYLQALPVPREDAFREEDDDNNDASAVRSAHLLTTDLMLWFVMYLLRRGARDLPRFPAWWLIQNDIIKQPSCMRVQLGTLLNDLRNAGEVQCYSLLVPVVEARTLSELMQAVIAVVLLDPALHAHFLHYLFQTLFVEKSATHFRSLAHMDLRRGQVIEHYKTFVALQWMPYAMGHSPLWGALVHLLEHSEHKDDACFELFHLAGLAPRAVPPAWDFSVRNASNFERGC